MNKFLLFYALFLVASCGLAFYIGWRWNLNPPVEATNKQLIEQTHECQQAGLRPFAEFRGDTVTGVKCYPPK